MDGTISFHSSSLIFLIIIASYQSYTEQTQEPGQAEADFGSFDVRTVIKNINPLLWK